MFQNIKNKAEFRNLFYSEVIISDCSGLRTSAASETSTASTTSVASMTSTASFHQKITRSAALMILGTKMTNTGPFLWNRWSKIQIFTDFSIFFAGGCWGQPMLFFFENWFVKLKFPNLLKPPGPIIQQNCWSLYPSELIYFALFTMRHPVETSIKDVRLFGVILDPPSPSPKIRHH